MYSLQSLKRDSIMYRAVLYTNISGNPHRIEDSYRVNSVRVDSWEKAEKILDNGTGTGFATGGHIEMKVYFQECDILPGEMEYGWFLCNEKPELV